MNKIVLRLSNVFTLDLDLVRNDILLGNQTPSISNAGQIKDLVSVDWLELSPRNVYLLTREFWDKIILTNNHREYTRVMLQYQFKYLPEEGYNQWRSLGHVSTTDFSIDSMNALVDYVSKTLWNKEASYYSQGAGDRPNPIDNPRLISELSIRYTFVNSNYPLSITTNLKRLIASDTFILGDGKDPISLINSANPFDWSDVVVSRSDTFRQFTNKGLLYTFNSIADNKQTVEVSDSNTLQAISTFTDTIKDPNNLRTFDRVFNSESRSYVNGILLHSCENDTKFITSINKAKKAVFKVITMDLETRLNSDKVMEPISISLYSPVFKGLYKTYFLSDYDFNPDLMIKACILDLALPVYNGYCIYLHNLSNFDGVFLLKVLATTLDSKNIVPLIKDGKILNLTMKVQYTKEVNGKKIKDTAKIHFRDSLLLLNNPLAKLATAFAVCSKGLFDMSRLENVSNMDLNSLRNDLLHYNKLDCLVLYQVLEKFASLIFKTFSLNITDSPTISSLAFAIYRAKFLGNQFNIPISNKKIFDRISQSYRGGHVDMFKPSAKKLYCYDINSLYPYVMKENFYPLGIPKWFRKATGLYKDLNNIFGFVKVNIYCPDTVKMPIIMTKVNDKVIAATGRWTGWYFTEELKYAITLGYEVEVLYGYHFDKKKIFNKFVNALYQMRLNYDKSDPRNLAAKLILNSLYGRFGMSIYTKTYKIIDYINDVFDGNEPFIDYFDWGSVGLYQFDKVNNCSNSKASMNVSISIASAVTAYARICIHKFKLIAGEHLYYTDTDSIFTTKMLPSRYVGNNLGQMKLEYKGVIVNGVFLAPKLYGLVLSDGSEVVKIKGVHSPSLKVSDLESLLVLNSSIDINLLDKESGGKGNIRWTRNWISGHIKQVETSHLIMIHESKRELIYKDNILVGTKSLSIHGAASPVLSDSSYNSQKDIISLSD